MKAYESGRLEEGNQYVDVRSILPKGLLSPDLLETHLNRALHDHEYSR